MNLQEQFEAFEQRIASQLKNFYQVSNAFSAQLETLQIPKLAHSVVAECTAALSEKWMLLDTTTSRLAHLEAIGERFVELEARNRKVEALAAKLDKQCTMHDEQWAAFEATFVHEFDKAPRAETPMKSSSGLKRGFLQSSK